MNLLFLPYYDTQHFKGSQGVPEIIKNKIHNIQNYFRLGLLKDFFDKRKKTKLFLPQKFCEGE